MARSSIRHPHRVADINVLFDRLVSVRGDRVALLVADEHVSLSPGAAYQLGRELIDAAETIAAGVALRAERDLYVSSPPIRPDRGVESAG